MLSSDIRVMIRIEKELSLGPILSVRVISNLYNSFSLMITGRQFHKSSRSYLTVFPIRNVQGNEFQPSEMLDSLLSL